ncbi:MAG: DUF2079 domain-containing protein [Candidatus Thermoplasmatota archaeon]|nr:DUF2079 domain-containing protein [Candidatus Thermoplasmatota archaeon]
MLEGDRRKYFAYTAAFSALVFAVLVIIGEIRYLDFYTLNGDLGINMQELWSTTHGFLLFETSDYKRMGAISHLEVHSSYIAVILAYLYLEFPFPITLFAVQDFFVAASIIAFFFLSEMIIGNAKFAFLISLAYGSSAILFGAALYDYHWLSYVPLESFVFFILMMRKRFLLAFIMLVIGSLTQEIFPFVAASITLYLFLESREKPIFRISNFRINSGLRYIFIGLMSLVFYVSLLYVQQHLLPYLLGNSVTIQYTQQRITSEWTPGNYPIATSLSSLAFWGIAYSLFLFLPALKPKHLILMGAWMYESIFVQTFYGTLGDQYDFVTISLLAPAAAMGLKVLLDRGESFAVKYLAFSTILGISIISAFLIDGFGLNIPGLKTLFYLVAVVLAIFVILYLLLYRRIVRADRITKALPKMLVIFIVVLLSLNFIVSPLNPVNDGRNNMAGYRINFDIPPQSAYMQKIQSLVPHNSTIIASDNLFTIVANDPYAYSFYDSYPGPGQPLFFPYNSTNPSQFLLVDSSESGYIFQWVQVLLNSGTYHLELEITGTEYPGNIYLYNMHYNGTPEIIPT